MPIFSTTPLMTADTWLGALACAPGSAAGAGIGRVFANLGVLIFNAIRPHVERAVAFIRDSFGGINLERLVINIGNVARRIGFILGNILSDPRLIDALGRIALAAGFIAVRFVQGFGEGVLSNLPGLADLLEGALEALFTTALRGAFDNPALVVKILGAVLVGSIVLRSLRRIGENWAKATAGGFTSGLRQSAARSASAVDAFFRSTDSVRARALERTRRDTISQYQRIARDISALGGRAQRLTGPIDAAAVSAAQTQLRRLRSELGDVAADTLILRRQWGQAFRGMGQVVQGALWAPFTRQSREGAVTFRTGLANMRQAFGDWATDLRARGVPIGQNLGAGVLGGLGAALAGREGGTLGFVGVLTAAISTGLATGSPLIGAAVAGVGALTAVFTAGKREAEAFARKIDDLVDAFVGLETVAERTGSIAQNTLNAISNAFDEAQEMALLSILPDDFIQKFAADVEAGTFSSAEGFQRLTRAMKISDDQLQRLSDTFGNDLNLADLDGQLRDLQAQLDNTKFQVGSDDERARLENQVAVLEEFRRVVESTGIDLDLLGRAYQILTDEADANAVALEISAEKQRLLASAIEETVVAQTAAASSSRATADALERQAQAAGATGNAFLDALRFVPQGLKVTEGFLRGLYDQLVATGAVMLRGFDFERWLAGWKRSQEVVDRGADAVFRLGDASKYAAEEQEELFDASELVRTAIAQLDRQRTDNINMRITFLRDQLEAAEETAQAARQSLVDLFTGGYPESAQAKIDDLITNLGGIGSAIEDAMQIGGVRGDAAIRSALGGLNNQIADIVQTAAAEGKSAEEIAALFAPVFAALGEEGRDALERILADTEFDFGVGEKAAALLRQTLDDAMAKPIDATVRSIFNADAEVAAIQRQLDFQEAQLQVKVEFSPAQIAEALAQAGLDATLLAGLDIGALAANQGLSDLQQAAAAANAAANVGASQAKQPPPNPPPPTVVQQDNTIVVQGADGPLATSSEIVAGLGALASGRPFPGGAPRPGGGFVS